LAVLFTEGVIHNAPWDQVYHFILIFVSCCTQACLQLQQMTYRFHIFYRTSTCKVKIYVLWHKSEMISFMK